MARPPVSAVRERLRIVAAVPALVAIFFLGQSALDRRGWRIDLTPELRYTLSDHAQGVLDALDADVRIVAFLRSQDPRNTFIRDLLRQLELRTRRLRIDVVDVNRSPALAREYAVTSYGALVVESGGRRRVVASPQEDMLIAAILQVTRRERRTIGWVVGHGEGDIGNIDRNQGYSTAKRSLEAEYYDVVPVGLVGSEVPIGTSALVIAGPSKDFLPEELANLDRYLQRSGHVLVLLDPRQAPGLSAFLERYHLRFGDDVVVDPGARLYGGEFLTMELEFDQGDHPILAPLTAAPLFSRTRSVEAAAGEESGGTTFLRTGRDSWATADANVTRAAVPEFVGGRDRRGPIGVGAEVVFRTPVLAGEEPRQGRVVGFGNAQFANNFFIEFLGNKDLFTNAVAWLVHDPQGVGRRNPKQRLGVNQFFVSEDDGARLYWASAVVLPGLFAVVGIALAARRRWG